jgi:hypothetical protein
MRTSSIISLVLLVTVVVSLLCIWFYPSIQDFMAGNTMWNGISKFSDEFNSEYIDTLDDLPEFPEKSVLIIIPYLQYGNEEMARVQKYVKNGGILLLMDDFGYGNDILDYLGINARFSNKALLDPLFCYKNQWMPKITDFNSAVKETGVTVVILNHATTLTGTGTENVIASSSKASYEDINSNEIQDENEPLGPFTIAAKYSIGKGQVIAVSDPSLVISSMVDRDDNYLFIKDIIQLKSETEDIFFDRSHLSKTPLDVSKIRLAGIRKFISNPYTLVGLTGLIFVVISRYTLRKGESIE